eukprot:1112707-Alexandrium_andersonii.AAC.2
MVALHPMVFGSGPDSATGGQQLECSVPLAAPLVGTHGSDVVSGGVWFQAPLGHGVSCSYAASRSTHGSVASDEDWLQECWARGTAT